MKIKYLMLGGLLTLSSVLTIASADDPFISYNNDLGIYDPSSFSLSDTFENYSIEVLDFSCSLSDPCLLSIQDDNGFNCDIIAMGDSITYNNCSTQTLSSDGSNVLTFYLLGEGYAGYDYINLRLVDGSSSGAGGSVSGDSSESDNELFGTISTVISNYTDSIVEWIPLIILVLLTVVAVVSVFRFVKRYTINIFTGEIQDPNKAYKAWKEDFIENKSTSIFNKGYKLSNGKVVDDSVDYVYRNSNSHIMMGYGNDKTTEEEYYLAFMNLEYDAGISRKQARKYWESDRAEGISYKDSVDRAYYDRKYSSYYD